MNRRTFLAQTAGAIVASASVGRARATTQRSRSLAIVTAELERQMPVWLRESHVPGLSIAIIENATVAWRHAFGLADAVAKTPVTTDTMFEAASMSKPVFAYVVMKLVEQGVLGLDVPLVRYTPDRFLDGDERLELITARHVLSHTTGFQNWRSDKSALAIHFTPGSQYMYSGEGYNYLQTVITRLLGRPFETYMAERLFEPFGMKSSCYLWTEAAARNMARAHDGDGKPADNPRPNSASVARYGSAGALLSTPGEFASFVCAVIAPPAPDAFHLGPERSKEMLRPHVRIEGGMYPASWALGWQIFHNDKRDFIYHGGDNAGFHCSAVASVAGKSGYVAMTNGENGADVLRSILTSDAVQAYLSA